MNLGETVISLGSQPLSNALVPINLSVPELKFPLDFKICGHCSLGQVGEYVSPSKIFSDYAYFSSTSVSWLKHAEEFADSSIRKFSLTPHDLILEIASNDGYLLKYFKKFGCRVLGVEPAANVAQTAKDQGIDTIVDFFGLRLATILVEQGKIPILVVCNNVLAHVPDINDFMAGLAVLVQHGATVSIEAPSMQNMLKNNLFDTIYHEHFSYLSATAVNYLVSAHNISLERVEMLPTHGGSYRYWVGQSSISVDSSVKKYISIESNFGLVKKETQDNFAKNCVASISEFRKWCLSQKTMPIGFGAAAKASVLLNASNITGAKFACIADNAPSKINHCVPGTQIPILSPSQVFFEREANCVIFPWNIATEIQNEITSRFPEFQGQIWTTLPNMTRIF